MKSYVTHLECSANSESYPANKVHGLSNSGKPLLVRYDLEQIKYDLSKDNWCVSSEPGFWRYQALLPVSQKSSRISLGEVITPLISLQKSATHIGGKVGNFAENSSFTYTSGY